MPTRRNLRDHRRRGDPQASARLGAAHDRNRIAVFEWRVSLAPLGFGSPLSSPRFLTTFDLAQLPTEDLDVLICGSGIAGLTVALSLAGDASVALMTKGSLGFGSTLYAQGGVAVAIGAGDRP